MSDLLPIVDLSSYIVGSSGSAQLPLSGLIGGLQPSLRIMNESGLGLTVVFSDGTTDFVPAGAWPVYLLGQTVTQVSWSVSYMIPNSPINQLILIYYYPGEAIPQNVVLGNSPIGVSGTVNTSVTNISNDGNVAGTVIVEATPSGVSSSAVLLTNNGNLTLGTAGAPGSFSTDDGTIHSNGAGTFTVPDLVFGGPSGPQIEFQPGGTELIITYNGTRVFHIDSVGNIVISGGLTQNGLP